MKARLINLILAVLLLLVVVCWIMQGARIGDSMPVLAITAAIVSAFVAARHFRLKATLDKVQAITLAPAANEHIVRVLEYIDKTNSNDEINRDHIESDEALFRSVTFILGFSDDLAIGIMWDIVDEGLAKVLIGNLMVRMFENLRPYIEEVDAVRGKPCYPNLTALCLKWNN